MNRRSPSSFKMDREGSNWNKSSWYLSMSFPILTSLSSLISLKSLSSLNNFNSCAELLSSLCSGHPPSSKLHLNLPWDIFRLRSTGKIPRRSITIHVLA